MFTGHSITFDDGINLETFQILRNMVLVQEDELKSETDSGIALPDSVVEQTTQRTGVVTKLGEGYVDESGKHHKPTVKVGDRVIYHQLGADNWTIDGELFVALRSEELLAVVEGESHE